MKKSLLTLSMLALFVAANAQDGKKAPEAKKTGKTEVVNPDGTTSIVDDATATKKDEPKKSGTRMAINEKGNAGTKHTTKTETSKETKTETSTSPTSKPQ
jgi:hypothetical protein